MFKGFSGNVESAMTDDHNVYITNNKGYNVYHYDPLLEEFELVRTESREPLVRNINITRYWALANIDNNNFYAFIGGWYYKGM